MWLVVSTKSLILQNNKLSTKYLEHFNFILGKAKLFTIFHHLGKIFEKARLEARDTKEAETIGFHPFIPNRGILVDNGKKDGHGIGLFQTFNKVRSWGGAIDIQSEVGVGTEFVIHLPTSELEEKAA